MNKQALVVPLAKGVAHATTSAAEGTWNAAKAVGHGTRLGGALVLGGGGLAAATGVPLAVQGTAENFRDSMALRNQFKGAGMTVLDRCYEALAQGQMTPDEVADIEKFAESLKEGGPFWDSVGRAGAQAGTAAGATLAVMGIAKGISSAVDALTYAGDFKAMMAAHPQLADYPEEQVRAIFASLRNLNPGFSKDPLVAGTFVFRTLQNRSSEAPGAQGMIELGTAKDVTQAGLFRSQQRSPVGDAANFIGQQAMSGFAGDKGGKGKSAPGAHAQIP